MLSIVIPYYKIIFFEDTLTSLSNQTDKRFKVYIGDDASYQNPSNLLENYKGRFDFVYYRFKTNLGGTSLTQQWERCIALSNSEEWVMILGDDDVLGENVVEEFYSNLSKIEKFESNVVRFSTVVINHDNEMISDAYLHPELEDSVQFLMRISLGSTRSSLSEYVFRKKVLLDVKFKNMNLGWHSDHLAVFECCTQGYIFSINQALVFFRLSGLNISSRKDNLDIKYISAFEYYYYLLVMKSEFFTNEQRDVLLYRLEKIILNNKKKVVLFFKFTKFYLVNYYFKRYVKTLIKMFKLVLKFK